VPNLRIPMDPLNPGQFYACCGLVELFELSGPKVLSHFELDSNRPRKAEFVLFSDDELNLDFVIKSVRDSKCVPGSIDAPPGNDSIAPISVFLFNQRLELDWWLNDFHDRARSLKCWAGQVTTKKLMFELPQLLPPDNASFDSDGFTSTRFGIDPRSAWVSLNLGYSPNEQGQESRTFPVVEMLAAFGLQGFRPAGDRAQGFRYALWLKPLPGIVARTAAAKPWEGLQAACYQFELGQRGSYKFFSFAEPILF
jgi:CRISPR-associated protein Csx14